MRLSTVFAAFFAGYVVAQHVHFEPPEVQFWVQSMLGQFSRYTHYPGPSPTASLRPRPTIPFSPFPTATCAYWLEDIKHQGLAAFNPDPAAYQVFRNVKDFGAKGTWRA